MAHRSTMIALCLAACSGSPGSPEDSEPYGAGGDETSAGGGEAAESGGAGGAESGGAQGDGGSEPGGSAGEASPETGGTGGEPPEPMWLDSCSSKVECPELTDSPADTLCGVVEPGGSVDDGDGVCTFYCDELDGFDWKTTPDRVKACEALGGQCRSGIGSGARMACGPA